MFISIKEAADRSHKNPKTIRRAIFAGDLPYERVQNQIRIEEADFEQWIQKNNLDKAGKQTSSQKKESVSWMDISDVWMIDGWKNRKDRTGYNFIDLFAGAGGLSCGLVMAGFNPIASVEIMPEAVATYRRNFVQSKHFEQNIETRDIRSTEVKESLYKAVQGRTVDVVVGGFPCQGFSMSGYRVVVDPRNSLYLEMKEIVEHLKPKYVVMENVVGLRSMLNGKIEEKIIQDYKEIGYEISIAVLNAADYCVAQTRRRVIFLANRLGQTNSYPKPLLSETQYVTVGQAIGKYKDMSEDKSVNHIFTNMSDSMKERLRQVPIGESLYPHYSDSWKKVSWEKPSCTVKENHGGVNIHPLLNRPMTPRELAALQSFPDDFIFEGSKKAQLTQIGNAVPCLMGKAIGLVLRKQLEKIQ